MKYAIFFLILIFPFGQLLRLPLSGNEAVLHFNDVVVGIICIIWLVRNRDHLKKVLDTKSAVIRSTAVWVIIGALALAINIPHFSWRQLAISSLYLWRFAAYAGVFLIARSLGVAEKPKIVRLLLLGILVVALAGLLQYIFLPNVAFLSADNWDDHYYRLISTFLDPGFTGAILVLGLVLAYENLSRGMSKWLYLGAVYLAMALTYSRAAFLTFLVSAGIVSFYRKSARLFIFCVLILAATIVLLPKTAGEGTKLTRENSILARIHNWQQSLTLWTDRPVLGSGFNTYRYVLASKGLITPEGVVNSHAGSADSSLLLVLVTTGILGLLAYLNIGRGIFREHRKSALIMASFGGIIVNSWFNNTLFYPWVMEWLWLILAVS